MLLFTRLHCLVSLGSLSILVLYPGNKNYSRDFPYITRSNHKIMSSFGVIEIEYFSSFQHVTDPLNISAILCVTEKQESDVKEANLLLCLTSCNSC